MELLSLLGVLCLASTIVPLWRVLQRAGLTPYWALCALLPGLGHLIVLGKLAFSRWPAFGQVDEASKPRRWSGCLTIAVALWVFAFVRWPLNPKDWKEYIAREQEGVHDHFFVSYAREQLNFAESLVRALKKKGFQRGSISRRSSPATTGTAQSSRRWVRVKG